MVLMLDLFILVMIAVMIVYLIRLNNRLRRFRQAQDDMAGLIGQLNTAIDTAQTSVSALKQAARSEENRLVTLTEKSRLLADELVIMIESGSNLANRIEQGLIPPTENEAEENETEESDAEREASNEADDELREALKNVR